MDAQIVLPMHHEGIAAVTSPRRPASTAYAELRRTVVDAGLLERRYGYYAMRTLGCYALLAVALALPIVAPPTLALTLLAAFTLGFVSVQIGMLGHDAATWRCFAPPALTTPSASCVGA